MINHKNIADPNSRVYCCLRNRVVRLDDDHKQQYCTSCKMFNGDADGHGVECFWDDIRETGTDTILVKDPYREWASNQIKNVQTVWGLGRPDEETGGVSA